MKSDRIQGCRVNANLLLERDQTHEVGYPSEAELQPFFHGEYSVLLEDGTRLKLSRNYRHRLELLLGKG